MSLTCSESEFVLPGSLTQVVLHTFEREDCKKRNRYKVYNVICNIFVSIIQIRPQFGSKEPTLKTGGRSSESNQLLNYLTHLNN